ncbi:hypothetical protein [Kineococcus sp. SYSU DK006]|uniref:hypothetical protein n=1 Tax=Kineococcus sp. SYSU DK006 TaxID=3383127 RepID=UPI003D7D49DA
MHAHPEDPAEHPPAPRGWVLVPAGEPGLLHRMRLVVRNSQDLVLVQLRPGAALPARACLGIGLEFAWSAPRLGQLVWFRDLTAAEVGLAQQWLAGPATALADPPAPLRHRIAAAQRAPVRARP